MPQWVNQTATRRARRVCLYDFLLSRHPGAVEQEGDSLRLRSDHSVSVKRGYAGFTDFADGGTGNAIEYLTNYLDYEFQDAVAALCEFDGMAPDEISRPEPSTLAPGAATSPKTPQAKETAQDAPERPQEPPKAPPRVFVPPEPVQGQYRQLYAYLTQQRGIPPALVQILINDGLLYQEREHNNMVFIDPARTFAEYRGTNSFVPFHRVDFSDPAAFWWFKPRGLFSNPTTAYICEGAIDAISLYVLLSSDGANNARDGLYCSIGGVANQQRIDRIKAGMAAAGCTTIIAVDSDQAGEQCRQRNPDCKVMTPGGVKDWNELLLWYENNPNHALHDAKWVNSTIQLHRERG